MKGRGFGCLTTGGLIALVLSLIAVGVSYAVTGNRMFSPGKLNAQSSGTSIRGVQSHADLEEECAACHPAFWEPIIMTNLCLDCHQGLVEQIKDSSSLHGAVLFGFELLNCRDCHTDHLGPEASMTNYLSDDFQHHLVGFSLTAHNRINWEREMVCEDCHLNSFTGFTSLVCFNCHQDENPVFISGHDNLFGPDCQACHDGIDTYGKDFDHNDWAFPLEGKHEAVSCKDCHLSAISLEDLQQTSPFCEICHLQDDVHQGVMGEYCGDCHQPAGWDQATFDHRSTGFLLVGGHNNLECGNCHDDQTYQGANSDCSSCHDNDEPHNGQFGEYCAACHVVTDWQEITFSHDGDYAKDCFSCHTVDKLAGHYPGQCSACHSTSAWRPASFNHQVAGATDCLACHTGNQPTNHFGGPCSTCHSTRAWIPASFNHTFPLNHGGANRNCQLCHTNNTYPSYSCYGCHEHSPGEIREEHEGISNLNNCVRCHWDGREHDDDDDDDD